MTRGRCVWGGLWSPGADRAAEMGSPSLTLLREKGHWD